MKNLLIIFCALTLFISKSKAQKIDATFFTEVNSFLQKQVKNGRLDYSVLKKDAQLGRLIAQIEKADLSGATAATKKAFYINAYNLVVINEATLLYPTASVQSRGGFFDRNKVTVAGERSTLTALEKKHLLTEYDDPRLHFVLVCGALGCPPITNFAYQPDKLEEQLNQQTRLALNNSNFIKLNGADVELSQIFKWYVHDFGGNKKAILTYINGYRTQPIPANAKVSYYDYDWALNHRSGSKLSLGARPGGGTGNNASRYVVSSTIPKGSVEVKIFNNLYTQRTGSKEELVDRSNFFTTTLSALYGLTNRFNIGVNAKYRRVNNDNLPSSPLKVFSDGASSNSARSGITGFGPQIRYAPVPKWKNFSIQSSLVFPIGEELEGINGDRDNPYIDWNGAIWNTQFFNDLAIGTNFSLFTEIDFLVENIGKNETPFDNRISTPMTLIFSYNPDPKVTLYTLGSFSPYWTSDFDYFTQAGLGAKYQFTPKLELELLYSAFTNKFLLDTGGKAATYNLGLRFNL